MVGGPGVRPAIVASMGPDDRFVFGAPGSPDEVAAMVADPELARAAIRAAAGVPDLDVEVLASMPLEFGAQVATRWREGSVFLAGDAAHRMPPFGGRGMNTAVADAHNLGWKLASVLRGVADPSLLDSYEAERGPVGAAQRVARPGPLPGDRGGARPVARSGRSGRSQRHARRPARGHGPPLRLRRRRGDGRVRVAPPRCGRGPGACRRSTWPATASRSSPSAKGQRGDRPRGR